MACSYDVAEQGITRMQHLQQTLETQTAHHGRLKGLLDVMQYGTDFEATSVLAQLRVCKDLEGFAAFFAAEDHVSIDDGSMFPSE